MWISRNINNNTNSKNPFVANVLNSNGSEVNVSALEKIENIPNTTPFGILSVPPRGAKAVVVPVGESAAVCGIVSQNKFSLQEGELALFSTGGASIVLKNDGSVVINGKIFEGEE